MYHQVCYCVSALITITLLAATPASAATISFSQADFITAPAFSTVTTFAFDFDLAGPLLPGLFSDPSIDDIQYSVSGELESTPSGFPGFAFNLDDIFPLSPPVTGAEFYALNPSAVDGGTLQFDISAAADLTDGLQVDELDELPENPAAGIGSGVVFHFNGREEGTGRYHPTFLQLRSDGMGVIQNADNMGGVNPVSNEVVDVNFGAEYVTNLIFEPAQLTIATAVVPEPSGFTVIGLGVSYFGFFVRRRRAIV